ncbi:MAG: efflux RND transporter periplasmic adaptor subunit [Rhodoferax sp.]|jgi:RND family efflux transporter MFP subunit|nr:efflux RND transporter periplasmic adaptor subunit [Rhodoferax sp.]
MKSGAAIAVGAIALAAAVGGGYWLGQSGKAAHGQTAAVQSTAAADSAKQQPKLLYYRNPMGLPDTSPTPKKDPMGMDYIAVFEGEAANDAAGSPNQVNISTQKVQKLGVRSEAAQLRSLDKTVRASGRVEPDERRIAMIAPKFEGYVERLHVNVTGQSVAKGQPLFEVYSPELVSVQREYAIAVQGAASLKGADSPAQLGMGRLVESSLQRLKNWDISEEQIKALMASGETRRTITFRSPVAGIVTEKKAVQGMRFMPGEALYQVSDLSAVWVVADVFEQDLGLIKTGAKAQVRINAYPDKLFEGKVTYVYPMLKAETRTVAVRVELANPGLLLKPGMFAQMEMQVAGKGLVVTVPVSAVIDSGTRQIVLIQLKEGRFEPREVKLGARSDTHVEVLSGVKQGEQVVVAANFLIDAESNLKAAVGGFGSVPAPATPAAASASASSSSVSSSTAPAARGAGHQAEGTVEDVDAKAGTVSLTHGPIASLKWPAMTMEFKVANNALLKALKPGAKVRFQFVERGPGEWVITQAKPWANIKAASSVADSAHTGH